MISTLTLENLPHTIALERDDENGIVVSFVDQRKLPQVLEFERTTDWCAVIDAIKVLAVRGAPAIGIAGASALVLWATYNTPLNNTTKDPAIREVYRQQIKAVCAEVANARPTAVNLRWAVDQVGSYADSLLGQVAKLGEIADKLFAYVKQMEIDDEQANRTMGAHGASLLQEGSRVLTHCNAGSLATVFYGTALGVIYAAAEQGKIKCVYADETRPVGQGSRLTAWELARAGVPCTLICDSMAASLMAKGVIDAVFVGADRIAANGDTANKIGTYGVAVLAHYHRIPFYVVAPTSTIDFALEQGINIPIEERDVAEVWQHPIEGVEVWNPAFDVTPAHLITRIVTEKGVFLPGDLR